MDLNGSGYGTFPYIIPLFGCRDFGNLSTSVLKWPLFRLKLEITYSLNTNLEYCKSPEYWHIILTYIKILTTKTVSLHLLNHHDMAPFGGRGGIHPHYSNLDII
jgi:hypothetical protein